MQIKVLIILHCSLFMNHSQAYVSEKGEVNGDRKNKGTNQEPYKTLLFAL